MNSSLKLGSLSDDCERGYNPQQIKKAYNLGNYGDGNGVKVAIFDFIGNKNIQSNIDVFSDAFNLERTELEFAGEFNHSKNFDFSAYIEPCADSQWVHAISPKADILVIRAEEYSVKGAINAINTALDNGADIILQTFQTPFIESYLNYTSLFEMDAVFIASAGDFGSGAFFPSCYPTCISVGGTSLEIGKNGDRLGEETVWAETGGGICQYFDIPDYQNRFIPIPSITNNKRGVPDVSFHADPEYGYSVYHSSVSDMFGWYTSGGTSIAASVVAAIIANYLSFDKNVTKREILPFLYKIAGETSYKNEHLKYNDIVMGNNGAYSARRGYDLCTGLGSLINL